MAASESSTGHKERAADKRVRAMDLRKRGVSFRNIGRALDISGKTAHQYVTDALRTLAAELKQETEEHVTLELARYDDLLLAIMPAALAGDLQAVDRVLKLSEARRKILGLDAPTKIAPTDPTGEHPYEQLSDEALERRIRERLGG